MKKLANWVLGATALVGGILVGEGIITGEELSSMQNILGLALGGGGLGVLSIINVITAIPKQAMQKGYELVVEKYGQDKVDSVINNFDLMLNLLNTVDSKLDQVIETQEAQDQARQDLLNG